MGWAKVTQGHEKPALFWSSIWQPVKVLFSAQTATRPHCSERYVLSSLQKGRQKHLAQKSAAYHSATDFDVRINPDMCSKGAWERSKEFAFILRSWLALNLSKTPIVVNGEKQDPQGNDREWPILDTNHKGDRHVWDRWDMGDTDETDTSHGMKWITLWKHLLPSTDCKGSRGWLAYT